MPQLKRLLQIFQVSMMKRSRALPVNLKKQVGRYWPSPSKDTQATKGTARMIRFEICLKGLLMVRVGGKGWSGRVTTIHGWVRVEH